MKLVARIGKEAGIEKLTLASGRRSFTTQLSVYMQKTRVTIAKGTKHSLGRGNMDKYIDCSKASMASPSRALAEQRKLANILKTIHEDNAIDQPESIENILFPDVEVVTNDVLGTPPPPRQPRGSYDAAGSPSKFQMLRKFLMKNGISPDNLLAQAANPRMQLNHPQNKNSFSALNAYIPQIGGQAG